MGGELFLIPYDGKDIGDFISDAQRLVSGGAGNIVHSINNFNVSGMFWSGMGIGINLAAGNDYGVLPLLYNTASGGLKASYENCSASISVSFYISY